MTAAAATCSVGDRRLCIAVSHFIAGALPLIPPHPTLPPTLTEASPVIIDPDSSLLQTSDDCCFCKTSDNQSGKFKHACSTARMPQRGGTGGRVAVAIPLPRRAEMAGAHFSNSRFSLIRGIDRGSGQPRFSEGPVYM